MHFFFEKVLQMAMNDGDKYNSGAVRFKLLEKEIFKRNWKTSSYGFFFFCN